MDFTAEANGRVELGGVGFVVHLVKRASESKGGGDGMVGGSDALSGNGEEW